jgi:dTMP kinase
MSKGFIISFEGGEGGGKSTQSAILMKHLVELKKDVISVREPGGSVIAEQIREVVLSSKNTGIAFTTEVLLFQASRAQIYHEVVLPALEAGKIILMDRTRDSSVVYQGIVRKFGQELIEQLNTISTHDTYPDITFLLDVPVDVGLKRREDMGDMNRLDMEKKDFHQQVREAYLSLAQSDTTGRWQVINGEQTMEKITKQIWKIVQKKLDL